MIMQSTSAEQLITGLESDCILKSSVSDPQLLETDLRHNFNGDPTTSARKIGMNVCFANSFDDSSHGDDETDNDENCLFLEMDQVILSNEIFNLTDDTINVDNKSINLTKYKKEIDEKVLAVESAIKKLRSHPNEPFQFKNNFSVDQCMIDNLESIQERFRRLIAFKETMKLNRDSICSEKSANFDELPINSFKTSLELMVNAEKEIKFMNEKLNELKESKCNN